MVELGSRQIHGVMGCHHGRKQGEQIAKRMTGKAVAADGHLNGQAVGIRVNYWHSPPTSKSNGWIGEQADPWGHGLPLQETRRTNCQKNGGESNGWDRMDGQAVGIGVN